MLEEYTVEINWDTLQTIVDTLRRDNYTTYLTGKDSNGKKIFIKLVQEKK